MRLLLNEWNNFLNLHKNSFFHRMFSANFNQLYHQKSFSCLTSWLVVEGARDELEEEDSDNDNEVLPEQTDCSSA